MDACGPVTVLLARFEDLIGAGLRRDRLPRQARRGAATSVSIETVRTHARSVFRKLGVKGRRELVRGAGRAREPL